MYIKNVLTWGRRPTRKIKGKPRINPAKKEKQIIFNSQLNAVLIGNPSIMGFIVPAYSHLFETICLWQLW